jgi:Ser/Thr protein kinase RdoA (MazF antagonist)
LKKARQKLKEVSKAIPEISASEIQAIDRYLQDEARRFDGPRLYSLIHGDPINGNVLIDKADKVTLIDLEYMHFGLHQYDLQIVRHYLLKDDDDAFQLLKRTYDLRRKKKAEESRRLEILCRLLVLLKSLRPKTDKQRGEVWWQRWTEIQSLARS